MTSANAAALWAGLHMLLLLTLSVLVVRKRQQHKVALGDGGLPDLAQAIRAFGNATEYIPAGLAVLALFAVLDASALATHLFGLTLFIGRVTHGIGLSLSGEATPARAAGVALSWLAYVFAAAALLFYAVA